MPRARDLLLPVFAIALLLSLCHSVRPAGREAKCRQLADDPRGFHGQRVLLSTAGCQVGDEPDTIVWRKFSHLPPVVVVHFAAGWGGRIPPKVDGVVDGSGSPVVVRDARPVW